MLFRPVFLLLYHLERIDPDVASHAQRLLQPAFTEPANLPIANGTMYTCFFKSFGRRCLLRRGMPHRPPLRYRPAPFCSGRDQEYLDSIVLDPIWQSRKLQNFHQHPLRKIQQSPDEGVVPRDEPEVSVNLL
jgi:hypothetical protein